jgi:hypothetical protein
MREQTIVMYEAAGSKGFSEIAEKTNAMLFRSASFVLGLGRAYLAVCYGIPLPTIELLEERNP